MASPENTTANMLEVDEAKYAKSDNYSGEKTYIVQPEGKLKRQLKNRHVAMIRFVVSTVAVDI
jgi:amino acid permease